MFRNVLFYILLCLCLPAQAVPPQLSELVQQYDKDLNDATAVSRLYKYEEMLWLDTLDLTSQANDALDFIAGATRHGLDSDDYHLPALQQLAPKLSHDNSQQFDVLLTDGLLSLIHDLAVGRFDAKDVDKQWFIPQEKFDAVEFLQEALLSPHLKTQLNALIPTTREYAKLTAALEQYQIYAKQGGWPSIPKMPLIRMGDSHPSIPTLRSRLAIEDRAFTVPITLKPELYDSVTEQAVLRFQQRHNLKVDGVIGSETRNELNVSAEDRVKQIKVTLERQRWLPANLGARYVIVNAANYTLKAIDNGDEILTMPVVVGRKDRPTPSFTSQITRLVMNPYWNVPHKLAILDLLPKQRANADYFDQHDIRVFTTENGQRVEKNPYFIDWSSLDRRDFPYRLRQDPGEHNALGQIKFLFPNPWSIYLHDTAHRELFKKAKRNFSSGCIRVADPLGFAGFIVADSKHHQKILDIISSKKNKGLKLAEPLPIYVIYLTVSVDDNGVSFSHDSYQRDVLIAKKLSMPSSVKSSI